MCEYTVKSLLVGYRFRSRAPTTTASRPPSPFCTTIKPASPLDCCAAGTSSAPIHYFVAVQFSFRVLFTSKALLWPLAASPQPLARCVNHLFSDTSVTTLVRPRSYLDSHRCGSLLCSFALPGTPTRSRELSVFQHPPWVSCLTPEPWPTYFAYFTQLDQSTLSSCHPLPFSTRRRKPFPARSTARPKKFRDGSPFTKARITPTVTGDDSGAAEIDVP